MAERVQVQGPQADRLRPQASPVSTFTRTPQNTLQAIARGLAEINPQISQLTNVVAERTVAEQTAAGEAEARRLQEQGATLAQATREGKLPAQMNPWFRAGLQEQFGRVSADTWQTDLAAAIASDDRMSRSTDLAEFDQFAQEHRQKWLEENVAEGRDGHFEKGFGSRSDAYYTDLRRQFAARIEDRLKKNSDDAHFAEVKAHVREARARGVSPEQIAADIDLLSNDVIAHGRPGKRVNETALKAVVAAALDDPEHGLEILNTVAKRIHGGAKALVADTDYGSQLIRKAEEDIVNDSWRMAQRNQAVAAQKREENKREGFTTLVAALLTDKHTNLRPWLAQFADDPEAFGQVVALRDRIETADFHTDDELKAHLATNIWTGATGPEAVTEEKVAGFVGRGLTTEDADWLVKRIHEAREAREGKLKGIFENPLFKNTLGNLKQQFASIEGNIGGGDGTRGANAEAMLFESWFVLQKSGKAAQMNPGELSQWFAAESTRIVNQQRGAGFQIGQPPAAPKFKEPVKTGEQEISDSDLWNLNNGIVSDAVKQKLAARGINTEAQLAEYVREQLRAYQKKTGRNEPKKPKAAAPAPAEE